MNIAFVLIFLWPTHIQHGPHFLLPMGPFFSEPGQNIACWVD